MESVSFGQFISEKRKLKGITLRGMARLLGVSAPYMTEVEKDRRNPFDINRLERIAEILSLTESEKATMLDLAGKKRDDIAPDLPGYIKERAYVGVALRAAKDMDASEAEWMEFVEQLMNKRKDQEKC